MTFTAPSSPRPPLLKPPSLRPGDTVGVVAPSSRVRRDRLEAGVDHLRRVGYRVECGASVLADGPDGFAGTHAARLGDLHAMFARDDIRAIVCARGGYGANYLLPDLDLDLVRSHPKLVVGYSDATCLLTRLLDATGLVTVQGPMVAKDFAAPDGEGVDRASWRAVVTGAPSWRAGGDSGAKPLRTGSARGRLYGGCLSLLVASLGTPFEIDTRGSILLLEDIAEPPYRLDRMLRQLRLAGKFDAVQGVVLGEMLDCGGHQGEVEETVLRVLDGLDVPMAFGMRFGHAARRTLTLPLGLQARLEAGSGVLLHVEEPATLSAATATGTHP